jgi:subtilisin-like proprotein convertase family protein
MYRRNNRGSGFANILKSLTASRSNRRGKRIGTLAVESLEQRLVLSAQYVQNHVLVGVDAGFLKVQEPVVRLDALVPGSNSRPLGDYGVFLMKLPNNVSVPNAIDMLKGKSGIRYAEPDWIGSWAATPNDPDYTRMWGMRNTGQIVNGTSGRFDADIDANFAWDQTTGSKSVLVAIVDSGTDYAHPDLAANIYVNAGEIAGNGIDDDSNGYVDDVTGYDFADGDADPMDFVGHGTHVTGTVGAVGDNGIGTMGVNWNVSILPCKIGNDFGGPIASAAIEAINYAVTMGATVSNHSYGINPTQAFEDAIINAQANNHLLVVAAGNSSSNNDFLPAYPASYPEDNIIAVAATDQNDDLAWFSSYGATSVDIGAPGVNIWSTTPQAGSLFYNPNYDFSDGTSMASPMVAGAVALLRSLAPTVPYKDITTALYNGADKLGSLNGRVATGARLNVNNSLSQLLVASVSVSPASIAENAGPNAATITIRKQAAPLDQPLTLNVIVSDPTEAVVRGLTGTSITIPAFVRQITLPVDAIDDTLLDGTQTVVIDLQYQGASVQLVTLDVTDYESVSVVATPDNVSENAGIGAGTLTVTRSNTDVFAPARVVAVGNRLRFYDKDGVQQGASITVPWPASIVRPTGQNVRDVTIMEDGRIAVFNGTSTVYISIYNSDLGTWTHQQINGATASAADTGTGGITTTGPYVFVSDLETSAGDAYGLIRYNVNTGAIDRFGTKSLGDRLFGSSWPQSEIYELDPISGAVIRTYTTPGSGDTQAGLAFDGKYLWYIENGSDALYKLDADTGAVVDTFFVATTQNSGFEGLAWMNGLLYMLDPFITDEIVVFDPVLRQTINRLEVGKINTGFNGGGELFLSGGLAPNPARNSLFVSATFSDEVYEISAKTGLILTRPDGSPRVFASGEYWEAGLATVGNKLYISPSTGGNADLRIHDFDGTLLGTFPGPFFFGLYGLGGDGISGFVDTSYRYRDVSYGVDGYIYALDDAGTILAKFDPVSLDPVQFLTLSQAVTTVSVDASGAIFGGTDDGRIVAFDPTGSLTGSIATTLGILSDIEINISGDIVASGKTGGFGYTNSKLQSIAEHSSGSTTAFISFGEHVTKNRGELIVTLTNSDFSEISIPLTVIIPEGQQSVVIPFDAIDDNLRDGVQVVNIGASATGYVSGSELITVQDYEVVQVDVVADSFAENSGAKASVVYVRRTDIDGPFDYKSTQSYGNLQTYQLLDRNTSLSPIVVPTQISRVTDLNVTVNFRHDWLGDLDVYLISPKGTRVELFTDLTSNEKNMTGTILDDQARTSIARGTAPFTGRFMPEGSLADVNGEEAQGTWYLEVTDDNVNDFGKLLGWSLDFSTLGLSATTVELTSLDTSEADFGGGATISLVIPANQSEVSTMLDAVDDTILDGPQPTVIAATSVSTPGLGLASDTVIVTDDETMEFSLSANFVSEAAGPAAARGILRRYNTDLDTFSVEVRTSDPSKIAFPGSVPYLVTFAAGSDVAEFPLDAVDNNVIDGDVAVIITVIAPEYGADLTQVITVQDFEPRVLVSTATPVVREDGGSFAITLQRTDGADNGVDVAIDLTVSGASSAVLLPASVTIPAGQDSISIPVQILDDTLLGDRSVTISAAGAGMISGSVGVLVTDYETVTLTVSHTSVLENAGPKAAIGTVTRSNTDNSLPLTVSLVSSDTTELTVPATVTIPEGQASVSFDIAAVNDPILDGAQIVQVSATATNYFGTSVDVTVLDHEPPVLTAPAAATTSPRPKIQWQAISGAVRYQVQVSNLSTGVSSFILRNDLTTPEFTPSENLGIGVYRVWVRAFDQYEIAGFWSVPRDFRVETAPLITAPVVTGTQAAPSFPQISWTAVADAARYELWVNNLTTGASKVIYKTDLLTTTYKSTEGLGSSVYRVFVRAVNSVGVAGQWSTAKDFTVFAAPVIQQPLAGSSFDRTPTFQWSAVSGATLYDLYVSNKATGAVVLRNQAITGTSLTATKDFSTGDYDVWVRAIGGKFISNWSVVRSFSIAMPPVILSPVANATTESKPLFSWTAVQGTERYELWVENIASKTRVIYEKNLTKTSFTATSNFAAGGYRMWVRAVSVMGEYSGWTKAVDFTVTAVEVPATEIPDTGAILAALLNPLATGVTPANRSARTTENRMPQQNTVEYVADVVVAERPVAEFSIAEIQGIDAVMEDWTQGDWWMTESAPSAVVETAAAESRRGLKI